MNIFTIEVNRKAKILLEKKTTSGVGLETVVEALPELKPYCLIILINKCINPAIFNTDKNSRVFLFC